MIKVRLNPDGSFRVVSWAPFLYFFYWKTTRHFKTAKETKAYIRELTKNDHSQLDVAANARRKLYA